MLKKMNTFAIPMLALAGLILVAILTATFSLHKEEIVEKDRIIQEAEFKANFYRIEYENSLEEISELKEQNYIYYDQLRQINANAEAETYLGGE